MSRPGTSARRLAVALGALGLWLAAPAARAEVDLNSADARELETLPGIGQARAQRIVEWREANGPFASLEDLRLVGGFAETTLEKLRPHVVVRPPKDGAGKGAPSAGSSRRKKPARSEKRTEPAAAGPADVRTAAAAPPAGPLDQEPPEGKVNLNLATVEQLQELPGVTEANARVIVAWRAKRGLFRTVNELARVPGLPPTVFATAQYFATTRVDANTATVEQLAALGASEAGAKALVAARRKRPLGPGDLQKLEGLSDADREALRPLLWFAPARR